MPIADAHEQIAALEILFRHLAPAEILFRIQQALPLLARPETNRLNLLVWRRGSQLTAAMLTQLLSGGVALVWPPQGDLDAEDRLLDETLNWLRQQEITIVQSILAPAEMAIAGPLIRNGFTHPTRIWSLRHDLTRIPVPATVTFRSYRDEDHASFAHMLDRTYVDTLDFPELSGFRNESDVLAGQRAHARPHEHWFWAEVDGQPVGVLMLVPEKGSSSMDLAYAGVAREYRRRGYGTAIVGNAIRETLRLGFHELNVSVDERNVPAMTMYQRLGFETLEINEAFLKRLN